MKKNKLPVNFIDVQFILLLITGLIAFIIKDFTIIFYYWCVVLGVSIIYYIYKYNLKYKKNNKKQLEALRSIRRQLYYFIVPGVFLYFLFYHVLDYKSPIEDLFILLFGGFIAVSIISLIVCIRMIIRKKQQLSDL